MNTNKTYDVIKWDKKYSSNYNGDRLFALILEAYETSIPK
jgi:hypothetical protein